MNQPKQKPPKGKQKTGSSLYEAQRRRTDALAIREELRNQQLIGNLVKRDVVEKEWFKVARQVRDALENVPARIAGMVASEKNQDKCFVIIEREIRQALEGLTA